MLGYFVRSVSENFFAMQGAALILPRQSCLSSKNFQMVKKFGGEIRSFLWGAVCKHKLVQRFSVYLHKWSKNE